MTALQQHTKIKVLRIKNKNLCYSTNAQFAIAVVIFSMNWMDYLILKIPQGVGLPSLWKQLPIRFPSQKNKWENTHTLSLSAEGSEARKNAKKKCTKNAIKNAQKMRSLL